MNDEESLCRTVLPSGRVVEYVEISTSDYLTIQQRVATKIGSRKDPNGLLSRTLTVVELIATCVRHVSKLPVKFLFKKQEQHEDDGSGDVAEAFLPPENTQREADVDAMCKDEYVAQFGGWQVVSYQEMMREKSEWSIKRLFAKLSDFNHLAGLIVGDDSKGVILGKAVVRSAG